MISLEVSLNEPTVFSMENYSTLKKKSSKNIDSAMFGIRSKMHPSPKAVPPPISEVMSGTLGSPYTGFTVRLPTVTLCRLISSDMGGGTAFGGGMHLWSDAKHRRINIF